MQSELSAYAARLLIPWLLLTPFQFGFHIAALNQISDLLSCRILSQRTTCIPMNDATFSIVTSTFMAGGLAGSLLGGVVLDKYGRKGGTRLNAALMTIGASIMTLANHVVLLAIGRTLIGLAAGVGLCVTPVYLNELAPPRIRGRIGVFNQMSVVLGILFTSSAGLGIARLRMWRPALAISAGVGVLQLLTSGLVVDTPQWLRSVGKDADAKHAALRIWSQAASPVPTASEDEAGESLLATEAEADNRELAQERVSIFGALRAADLRRPVAIVSWANFAQQVCGINAVLYYSNTLLAGAVPEAAAYVSLAIAVINAIMTVPAIFLIERMGRRNLISLSAAGALASLIVIGFGINAGKKIMPSVAILTFVGSFAIGLGPVPFIITPEVSPFHAVSALSSIAIAVNWLSNLIIGITFLPLRNWLADNVPWQEGRVFYLFAAMFLFSFLMFLRVYRT